MEWLGRRLFLNSEITSKSSRIFVGVTTALGGIAIIPTYLILFQEGISIMGPVMIIGAVVGFLGGLILLRSWKREGESA